MLSSQVDFWRRLNTITKVVSLACESQFCLMVVGRGYKSWVVGVGVGND